MRLLPEDFCHAAVLDWPRRDGVGPGSIRPPFRLDVERGGEARCCPRRERNPTDEGSSCPYRSMALAVLANESAISERDTSQNSPVKRCEMQIALQSR